MCKILGEQHPYTLNSLNNLAYYYYSIHNYTHALNLAEQAYSLRSKVLGDNHPHTLNTLHVLSSIFILKKIIKNQPNLK